MKALRVLLLVVAVAVLVVAVRPARIAVQTLVLLPSLMDAGVRPLEWVTEAPRRLTLPYRDNDSPDRADLWLPAGTAEGHPVGAIVLVLGVNNVGRDHPAVRRVAQALARSGIAVIVPDSAVLLEGRLEPAEIDGIVQAFKTVRDHPEVDRGRVGIAGFSAGGSLALLAAADPRIATDIRYVNAFGAFADAREYVAELAAHAYERDGREIPWRPTPLALAGFPRLVVGQLDDPTDRRLLTSAFDRAIRSGARPGPDASLADRLSPRGRSFYRLVTARDLDAARAAVEGLPGATRATLDALSPLRHLDDLRAPVHLMHELDDHHVPFVESRRLAVALDRSGRLARHTEFRLFSHVQPDDLDPVAAAPESWKLLWHVHALMLETVD